MKVRLSRPTTREMQAVPFNHLLRERASFNLESAQRVVVQLIDGGSVEIVVDERQLGEFSEIAASMGIDVSTLDKKMND